MNTFGIPRTLVAWTAGAAFWMCAVAGAQAAANPPIRMADGIEYMCGGTDKSEAQFMQMVAPRWAATLEFALAANARGTSPRDVAVQVRSKYSGETVMQTTATGPLMLARLEPGLYEVEATVGGITLLQLLNVSQGIPAQARFVWPSNIDVPPLAGRTMVTQDTSAR